MKKIKYKETASEKLKRKYHHLLSEDEELILVTGYGRNYLINKFAYFMIIPGGVFWTLGFVYAYFVGLNPGLGLLLGYAVSMVYAAFRIFFMYHSRRYLLTTRRVIVRSGILTIDITSALFDKITHIQVDQSLIDRLVMHHGVVIIHTAGMNKGEIKLAYIDSPLEFKNLLERLINRHRDYFGNEDEPVFTYEGELVS